MNDAAGAAVAADEAAPTARPPAPARPLSTADKWTWPIFLAVCLPACAAACLFLGKAASCLAAFAGSAAAATVLVASAATLVCLQGKRFHYQGGRRLYVCRTAQHGDGGGGGRDVVVFLHGMLASSRFFDSITPSVVKAGGHCLAVDLLGFGRSPWPKAEGSYSLDEHCRRIMGDVIHPAAAAAATAAAVASGSDVDGDDEQSPQQLCRIHLVGHSLGAVLAVQVACRVLDDPSVSLRMASVTLISAPFFETEQVR